MKTFLPLTVLLFCTVINAKQLDLGKVSQNSNWIMHMDFESMRSSEIGVFIEDAYENIPEIQIKIRDVQEKYGLDLMNTSSLTMFGSGEKHKGIGILEGGVDASIVNQFAQSKDSIESSKMGKNIIFSSQKGRRPMAFTALKNGKMIFGPDQDYVSEGIFLAKRKGKGSSGHLILQSLNELIDDPGFVLFANMKGAKEVTELDQWVRLMTDKIDSCGMVIGDQDGGLKIIGLIETNSIESTEPMENMIRGGLAMMDMKVKNDDRMKEFLNGYKVVREGKIIRVEIELSNSLIIERIKKEMKKAV
jgi:hypothetical protein